MIRKLFLLFLVLMLSVGCAQAVTISEYASSNSDGIKSISAVGAGAGQTFTPDACYDLETASFYLSWAGNNGLEATAYLFDVTGTSGSGAIPSSTNLSNAIAVSNTVTGSTFSDTPGMVEFTFSDIRMKTGRSYAVLVIESDRVTGANLNIGWDTTSGTHPGNAFYRNNGGTTAWTASGYDTIFSTAGTLISTDSINITSTSPDISSSSVIDESQTFTVESDASGAWTWYLDGTQVQTNESATSSSFTTSDSVVGTHTIRVDVETDYAIDTYSWSWVVVDPQNYYVSTTGNDSADGSLETPFRTPSHAVQIAAAGDTIYLIAGTWNDTHLISNVSGTSDNPITITSYGGTSTLDGLDLTGTGIDLTYDDYWIVDNVNLTRYYNAVDASYCDNVVVKNCGISHTAKAALVYTSAENSAIINNVISYADWNMIQLGGTNFVCQNVTVQGNDLSYGTGHALIDLMSNFTDVKIFDNVLRDTGYYSLYTHQTVTDGYLNSGYLYINNNTFYNVTIGINFDDPANNSIISNNTIYGIMTPNATQHLKIGDPVYNLTLSNNNMWGDTYGYMVQINVRDSILSNNNITAIAGDTEYRLTAGGATIRNATVTGKQTFATYVDTGGAIIDYPNGRVFTASSGVVNYSSSGSIYTYDSGSRVFTLYDYSAKPANENVTVTPRAPVSSEILNFTAESTNGNAVTFTAWNLTYGYQYRIKEDGVEKSTQLANETGQISWVNSEWSPHVYTVEETGLRVPVAAFTANETDGTAPLDIQFTDNSTQSPTSWAWDFDGDSEIDSTEQNPVWTYDTDGNYTVSLTVINALGSDTETKTGYIKLTNPYVPPILISASAAVMYFFGRSRRWW